MYLIKIYFENIFNKSNHEIYKINKNFMLFKVCKVFYEFIGVLLLMALIVIMTFSLKEKI